MASELLYPPQNPIELGDYYMRHVGAMTAEGLHSKADIAEQLAWRDREIDRLEALAAREPGEWSGWHEGAPPHPWDKEWFIAVTTYGDRVVLTALPEEYTYDFKTADDTYLKRDKIEKWMQFPDSSHLPHTPVAAQVSEERCDNCKQTYGAEADLLKVLQRIKFRLHFMGWPAESFWNNGSEESPHWIPDWRYEIGLIENALNGSPITSPEKPTDTVARNTLPDDLNRRAQPQQVGVALQDSELQRQLENGVRRYNELPSWLKQSAEQPEPIGHLTITSLPNRGSMENIDFDYSGELTDGVYQLFAVSKAP